MLSSGKDFEDQVVQLAQMAGWKVAHFRPCMTNKGWRTAIQGDPGFFDLVLIRRGRVVFAELKTGKARMTKDQQSWANEVGNMPSDTPWQPDYVEYYLWRPTDFPEIQRILTRRHD